LSFIVSMKALRIARTRSIGVSGGEA